MMTIMYNCWNKNGRRDNQRKIISCKVRNRVKILLLRKKNIKIVCKTKDKTIKRKMKHKSYRLKKQFLVLHLIKDLHYLK